LNTDDDNKYIDIYSIHSRQRKKKRQIVYT